MNQNKAHGCARNRPTPQKKTLATADLVRETPLIRWDEKAGLRRDAIRSQLFDVLKAH